MLQAALCTAAKERTQRSSGANFDFCLTLAWMGSLQGVSEDPGAPLPTDVASLQAERTRLALGCSFTPLALQGSPNRRWLSGQVWTSVSSPGYKQLTSLPRQQTASSWSGGHTRAGLHGGSASCSLFSRTVNAQARWTSRQHSNGSQPASIVGLQVALVNVALHTRSLVRKQRCRRLALTTQCADLDHLSYVRDGLQPALSRNMFPDLVSVSEQSDGRHLPADRVLRLHRCTARAPAGITRVQLSAGANTDQQPTAHLMPAS